eukprot:Rmarinus@m.23938
MGRITPDLILWSGKRRPCKGETPARTCNRLTHIHLANRGITQIEGLNICPQARVLYIYGNQIENIEGLETLKHLECLYLQDNRITSILRGLNSLKNLRKLYLNGNYLRSTAGLEALPNLEEVHINHQKIGPEEALSITEESMDGVGRSLLVLDISHNHVVGFQSLRHLARLQKLDASFCDLTHWDEVREALSASSGTLVELDLRGNPALGFATKAQQRDMPPNWLPNRMSPLQKIAQVLPAHSSALKILNGHEVSVIQHGLFKLLDSKRLKIRRENNVTMPTPPPSQHSPLGALHLSGTLPPRASSTDLSISGPPRSPASPHSTAPSGEAPGSGGGIAPMYGRRAAPRSSQGLGTGPGSSGSLGRQSHSPGGGSGKLSSGAGGRPRGLREGNARMHSHDHTAVPTSPTASPKEVQSLV